MTEITDEYNALVMALKLAITAPEGREDEVEYIIEWAQGVAVKFDVETVERAKAEALAKAMRESSDA